MLCRESLGFVFFSLRGPLLHIHPPCEGHVQELLVLEGYSVLSRNTRALNPDFH